MSSFLIIWVLIICIKNVMEFTILRTMIGGRWLDEITFEYSISRQIMLKKNRDSSKNKIVQKGVR